MKSIIVLSLAGLMAVAFAAPAAATSNTNTLACDTTPTWSYGWDKANTVSATLDVEEGTVLCEEVTLQASSYVVPLTWDGNGFNPSATPQRVVEHKPITFKAGATDSTLSSTLEIPACGAYQVDLYRGPQQDDVFENGSNGFLKGGIVSQPACAAATPAAPTLTPGTCEAPGSVSAVPTADYTWAISGPTDATVYTAVARPGRTLVPTEPWVFDLSQVAATEAECLPAVIVVDPVPGSTELAPVPPTCDVDGSLILVDGPGFIWEEPVVLGAGVHTVTANATPGYTFADGQLSETFEVTVLAATGTQSEDAGAACFAAVTVPPEVPVTPETTTPVAAVVVPVATPTTAVAAAAVTAGARTLAVTGIEGLSWLLAGAAGLIGLGALVVTRARRGRPARH